MEKHLPIEQQNFSPEETRVQPVLKESDFVNKVGIGVFKDLNRLLRSLPIYGYNADYVNLLKIVAEGKFGVVINSGYIELHPIKLESITFSDFSTKKIFIHETKDPDLNVVGDLPENNFTYVSVIHSPVAHGFLRDGEKGHRILIDAEILFKERNIYLDPESIEAIRKNTELGKSFIIPGGIPKSAILEISEITSYMQTD